MEQISYEILLSLLKKPNHARQLAIDLKTNHMTINRRIKDLEKNNVIDYNLEGKNKVYFIKNTLEAKQNILMSEHYKLITILNKYPNLRNIFEKIINNQDIDLAILFGSYAKNIAKKESDIDIFIQTQNRELKKQLSLITSKLNIKIGKYDTDNLLIKEIENNHVIIKGVENYYEQTKFFF